MNPTVIIGVILIGVGTGLTLWGHMHHDTELSRGLGEQFEKFRDEIRSAKESPPDQVTKKLASIESEFNEWADDFLQKKGHKAVEVQQARLDAKAEELLLSAEYRPIYEYALKTVKGIVLAYNQKARTEFRVDLPDLPENLYDSSDKGKIVFGPAAVWEFGISSSKPAEKSHPPRFEIDFRSSETGFDAHPWLILSPDGQSFNIVVRGTVPHSAELKKGFPVSSYHEPLKELLTNLVEAQILELH